MLAPQKVRYKPFQADDVQAQDFKGVLQGPAVLLGIYRIRADGEGNVFDATAAATTISVTVGDRTITEPDMLWHGPVFNPGDTNQGPRFKMNEPLDYDESLDLQFRNGGGADKDVYGFIVYVRRGESEPR